MFSSSGEKVEKHKIPSGKLLHNYGKSHKITIFNSYVCSPEGNLSDNAVLQLQPGASASDIADLPIDHSALHGVKDPELLTCKTCGANAHFC